METARPLGEPSTDIRLVLGGVVVDDSGIEPRLARRVDAFKESTRNP